MRRVNWIGLAAAVVFLVGYILLSAVPGGGEVEPADFEEFYVTDDQTAQPILAVFLIALGSLGLLWLLWELRVGIGTSLAQLAFVAGAVGLTLVVGGAALLEAPSGVQAFSEADFVGEPVAHTFAQAGWAAILIGGALFLGLAIASSRSRDAEPAPCSPGCASWDSSSPPSSWGPSSGSRVSSSPSGSSSPPSPACGPVRPPLDMMRPAHPSPSPEALLQPVLVGRRGEEPLGSKSSGLGCRSQGAAGEHVAGQRGER